MVISVQHIDPIEIEIGFGNGSVIKNLAKANPSHRYIAIEKDFDRCESLFKDIQLLKIKNIQVINQCACEYLETMDSCLANAVHIYFPTPYPNKARIFNFNFGLQVHRILERYGNLRVVTDHEEYFRSIFQLMRKFDFIISDWNSLQIPLPENYLTGSFHEKKYRPVGEIHALCLMKHV